MAAGGLQVLMCVLWGGEKGGGGAVGVAAGRL